MNARTLLLVGIGIAIGGLAALLSVGPSPVAPGTVSSVSGKALIGGPFELTNQDGVRVSEKDFLGRYALIFFGFTHCPDICPSGLQVMSAALDKLGPKANLIQPIFITVDGARDTPDKLKAYLKSFHPGLVGLTGTEVELEQARKTFRVYAEKVTDQSDPTSYTYDHSTIFYLMGKDGAFMVPVPHTTDPNAMADELNKAID